MCGCEGITYVQTCCLNVVNWKFAILFFQNAWNAIHVSAVILLVYKSSRFIKTSTEKTQEALMLNVSVLEDNRKVTQ